MATFGITPVTGYPLPPSDAFPEFIQFQAAGANLGGPDADTVNFSTGTTATRGTGENANVVTVTAGGGAGGVAFLGVMSAGAQLSGDTGFNAPWAETEALNSAGLIWDIENGFTFPEGKYSLACTVNLSFIGLGGLADISTLTTFSPNDTFKYIIPLTGFDQPYASVLSFPFSTYVESDGTATWLPEVDVTTVNGNDMSVFNVDLFVTVVKLG